MAYENKKTGQIGTLYELLPNVSNALLFTEEELLERDIIKHIPEVVAPVLKPLDEYKIDKYNQVKEQGKKFILDKYSIEQQTSALAGFYTPDECTVILDFAKKYFDIIRLTGTSIINALTYEEVDLVYFSKDIINEETLEVISSVFWGE